MILKDLFAYLDYLVYLVWIVQGARLLAMLSSGSWDRSPPLSALVPAFLRTWRKTRR